MVRVELLRVLVLVYSLRRAVTKSAHLYTDSNIEDHALDKIIYSVQEHLFGSSFHPVATLATEWRTLNKK